MLRVPLAGPDPPHQTVLKIEVLEAADSPVFRHRWSLSPSDRRSGSPALFNRPRFRRIDSAAMSRLPSASRSISRTSTDHPLWAASTKPLSCDGPATGHAARPQRRRASPRRWPGTRRTRSIQVPPSVSGVTTACRQDAPEGAPIPPLPLGQRPGRCPGTQPSLEVADSHAL